MPGQALDLDSRELLERLMALSPGFALLWQEDSKLFGRDDESPETPARVFAVFSSHISQLLARRRTAGLEAVFSQVEEFVSGGAPKLADAATTCFLENILNRVPETIDPDLFVPLLGPASRAFCRAWDEFTGVRTKGLW